jgi:Domain of unknown function (DUF4262)
MQDPHVPAMSTWPQRRAAYLARVRALIEQHGWMVQAVLPTATDPATPPCFYTVGLTSFGQHPELIAFGLPPETATWLLNTLGDRVREGEQLTTGQRLEGLLEDGYALELLAVDNPTEVLTIATDLFGSDVRALQLVWPDTNGCFPWDPGFDPRFTIFQPLLGSPPRPPD